MPFSLRIRARSLRWAASTSGWRALALRQCGYRWSSRVWTVWLGWWELAGVNCRSGPKCASMGLAQEALVGVKK
ncbi:hypothetical protein [Streptomyces noursei]|uniref:hypothetical protein n=1 Tax=Streptomyces noursei TaxID=1971 RepID=UPI003EBF8525